jgi:predicted GNAT family acetyltransferase
VRDPIDPSREPPVTDAAEPTLTVHHAPERQRFEVDVGGDVAHLDYSRRDGRIALNHTEVPDAFEGRGVGSRLARAALEHARAEGLRVLVLCPFVRAWLERHPEYADLVERG